MKAMKLLLTKETDTAFYIFAMDMAEAAGLNYLDWDTRLACLMGGEL